VAAANTAMPTAVAGRAAKAATLEESAPAAVGLPDQGGQQVRVDQALRWSVPAA